MELKHFYGSNAFQLMKDLSNQVVKKYLPLGQDQPNESLHFPWIKEYNRFVAKCRDEEFESRQTKSSYNLTEDIHKAKKKEWWYRQKYKLMKALKKKWDQSYKKTYEIVQKMNNDVRKRHPKDIDYNHLQTTSISFEKIPLLKFDSKDDLEDLTAESTNLSKGEIKKRRKKNMSTNTGPDVILMLNDLKLSREKDVRREISNELKELYKLNERDDSDISEAPNLLTPYSPNSAYNNSKKKKIRHNAAKSVYSLSEVTETQSSGPYGSKMSAKKHMSNKSGRYSSKKELLRTKAETPNSPKADKYTVARLQNLDRLEKQITGKPGVFRQSLSSVISQNNDSKLQQPIMPLEINADLVKNMRETSKSNKAVFPEVKVEKVRKNICYEGFYSLFKVEIDSFKNADKFAEGYLVVNLFRHILEYE